VAVASVDHMQIICTLLQTDNHSSTSPLGNVASKFAVFFMPHSLVFIRQFAGSHVRDLMHNFTYSKDKST